MKSSHSPAAMLACPGISVFSLSESRTHSFPGQIAEGTLMRKMWASYLLKRGSASLLETAALTAPPGCQTEMQGVNGFLRDANWPKLNALQQLAYKKIRGKCSGFKRHLELCGHFSVKSRKLEEIRILLVLQYLLFYSHACF